MEESETSVNTGEVAESQTETQESSVNTDVTIPTQDAQTNAAFAEMRRKAESAEQQVSKANQMIAKLYGEQGIQDLSALEKALQEQEATAERQRYVDAGMDPDLLNQYIEKHPDVQYARELKSKQDEQVKFQSEAAELFEMVPDLDAKTIQPEVWALRDQKGISLADAYLRVNFKSLRTNTEQETIRKLSQNAQSTPGALGQEGADHQKPNVKDMSSKDFEDMILRVKRGEKVNL